MHTPTTLPKIVARNLGVDVVAITATDFQGQSIAVYVDGGIEHVAKLMDIGFVLPGNRHFYVYRHNGAETRTATLCH